MGYGRSKEDRRIVSVLEFSELTGRDDLEIIGEGSLLFTVKSIHSNVVTYIKLVK